MRKYIGLLAVVAVAVIIVTTQNCGGTRFRSGNLDVSRDAIDQQLTALKGSISSSSLDSASQTAANNFFTLLDNGASLYYAEAPGSMGNVAQVLPLDFGTLGVSTPSKAYVYFAYLNAADGAHGALLIASGAQAAAAASPSPTPGTTSATQTPLVVFSNNGEAGLAPGSFSEADFSMDMSFQGSSVVNFYSTDVVDGDLANTIQFEVFNSTQDGTTSSLGLINLIQPN